MTVNFKICYFLILQNGYVDKFIKVRMYILIYILKVFKKPAEKYLDLICLIQTHFYNFD